MVLDLLIKKNKKEKPIKKKKRTRKVDKILILVKKDIPKFVIPYIEGVTNYPIIEFNGTKMIELGPFHKEDIIALDKKIAYWLLEHYGDEFFERINIK